MSNSQLEQAIEAAWEARDTLSSSTTGEMREAIEETLNALDGGTLRVAEKQASGDWHVNQWAKKAVLLGFRIQDMAIQEGRSQNDCNTTWHRDRLPESLSIIHKTEPTIRIPIAFA